MAKQYRTFNTPNCYCGQDHDSLAHMALATMAAWQRGDFDEYEDPMAAAAMVLEDAAEQVGWVKAAAELEDLRELYGRSAGKN